ncbi:MULTISPECIES: hypothetical protein [unclassified Roseivivax]|uniref:hypothetical protein n=1 Tax=unclassified Roseivivax TaxID=2639302 RepID=UPI0012692CB3|nr:MULTISPECIES: hypothetical protein [unclassified Roseivivax]
MTAIFTDPISGSVGAAGAAVAKSASDSAQAARFNKCIKNFSKIHGKHRRKLPNTTMARVTSPVTRDSRHVAALFVAALPGTPRIGCHALEDVASMHQISHLLSIYCGKKLIHRENLEGCCRIGSRIPYFAV